ncbi:unnamed protein product [Triticum turgidum subsp. durum]|uniref:Chromo domain-containing protein n=1 Tax=Triticum turgidum subsp. durum TaxID=4567 RepID=A0A9R1RDV3_TRITD|nr:unnamed protein product [Triticum turgidum subsp. durum]
MSCAVPDLDDWLQDRAQMEALLRQHLLRARQQMKESADKKRSVRVFAVKDWVFLKIQPYIQRSLATRANRKLSFRYFGPFQVVQQVGQVTYKLQLPASCSIHPVFHVSQLRRALLPVEQALDELPAEAAPNPEPVEILDTRLHHCGTALVPQVLIRWTGQPASVATWEDREELQHHYPAAPAWGQADSQEGGNVTDQPTTTATAARQGDGVQQRTRRAHEPNKRYTGPEWTI